VRNLKKYIPWVLFTELLNKACSFYAEQLNWLFW